MKIITYLCFILIAVTADYTEDGLEYASPPSPAYKFVPFPKILWTSWDSGLDNVKIFTKLCINNMNHFSKQSGFQLRFVTDQNFTSFLSPESNRRYNKIMGLIPGLSGSGKSDILRAFLLYENGGIWSDVHSYFLEDLSWVQHLYKTPGVYNRFFPNPNVLVFTKNKDYSGNKTKIFDQKLQQQVYLFPGMENWFLIAKPKSEFFNDVLTALERYFTVGRKQIFDESNQLGIKFGGESNGYFARGSFQFQYVLQKKQKELDSSKNPSTKYAVEYYKMWFMNCEYTGFIFLAQVSDDQQINLQFQYSQKMLSNLYGFPVRPYFVKNIGWIATAIDRILQKNGYRQTCLSVSNVLKPESLIYKYLINITSMFKEVDHLKYVYSSFEGKCNPLDEGVSGLKDNLLLIKKITIGILLSIPIIGLILYFRRVIQIGNYEKVKFDQNK